MCYGSEFTAIAVRTWLGRIGVKTLYIEPGTPNHLAPPCCPGLRYAPAL